MTGTPPSLSLTVGKATTAPTALMTWREARKLRPRCRFSLRATAEAQRPILLRCTKSASGRYRCKKILALERRTVFSLAGADAHCQAVGTLVGAGARTWHAYLSTQATAGAKAENARR